MFKLGKKILTTSMVVSLLASIPMSSNASTPDIECQAQRTFLNSVSKERALNHVKYLSETIGPRIAGTKQEYQATQYIAKEFEKLGYKVEIQEFNFRTMYGYTKKSWNVEAVRAPNGNDASDTNKIVYVTAHHDSVRRAPGANDNASGVASMLEIANSIKDLDIDREVRFIACGAEEEGLHGSTAYVKSLSREEKARSIGCFNLDMVATNYAPVSELAVFTYEGRQNVVTDAVSESGRDLAVLNSSFASYDGEHERTSQGNLIDMGYSDHVPFANAGIPSALFINVDPNKKHDPSNAIEPYYHKPQDHTGNISPERLERSVKLIGCAIYETVDVDHEVPKTTNN